MPLPMIDSFFWLISAVSGPRASSRPGRATIAIAIVSVVLRVAWGRGGLRRRSPAARVAALAGLTLFRILERESRRTAVLDAY